MRCCSLAVRSASVLALLAGLLLVGGCGRSSPTVVQDDSQPDREKPPTPAGVPSNPPADSRRVDPNPTRPPDLAKDPAVRPSEYEKLMKAGATAFKQKRYSESIRTYNEVLRKYPNDVAAVSALREVNYTQHMADGDQAMRSKKYAEAVKEYEAALKEMPDDKTALAELKQALAALGTVTDRQLADYEKNMKEGQTAMKAKKYADAVKEFEQALKAKPGDPAASLALKEAQREVGEQKEFDKHMKDGQAAMRAKKYADAVKAFEAALKLNPGDKTALADLKKAKAALK